MSRFGTHEGDVKAKAVMTLRTLASVAIESAELARILGMAGEGWMEDELARYWRLLGKAVEGGLIEKLAAMEEEPPF